MKNKTKNKTLFKRLASAVSAVAMAISCATSVVADKVPGYYIKYDWSANNPTTNVQINAKKNSPAYVFAEEAGSLGEQGEAQLKRVPKGHKVSRFMVVDEKDKLKKDNYVFCIQPNVSTWGQNYLVDPFNTKDYTENNFSDLLLFNDILADLERKSPTNNKLKYRLYYGMTQYYGYPGYSTNAANYVATQLILWEITEGYRLPNEEFSCSDSFLNKIDYSKCTWVNKDNVKTAYNNIVTRVQNHYDVPDALNGDKEMAKDNPYLMKYNTANKRYQTTIKIPTKYVTKTELQHNFSSLDSSLKKFMDACCDGTYKADGTGDYGVIKTTSGTNTLYTLYTNDRTDFTSMHTTAPILQQLSSNVKLEETFYVGHNNHSYTQAVMGSTKIDNTEAFISVVNYNEPNINFEKIYQNAFGVDVEGEDLADYLKGTKFKMYCTVENAKQYVKATKSGGNYSFTGYTTEADATVMTFDSNSIKSNKGQFVIFDVPTSNSDGRTYTLDEVEVPAGYTKKKITIKVPSPSADDNSNTTVPATMVNTANTGKYGTAWLEKQIIDENGNTVDSSELADDYRNTKVIAGYMDEGTFKVITQAYKAPADAIKNDTINDMIDVSKLPTYSTNDGRYYLPINVDSDSNIVLNPGSLSTDPSKAQIFTIGNLGSIGAFGKLFLNFVPLNSAGEPINLVFMEIQCIPNVGYPSDYTDTAGYISNNSFYNFSDANTARGRRGCIGIFSEFTIDSIDVSHQSLPFVTPEYYGGNSEYAVMTNQQTYYNLEVFKKDTDNVFVEGAVFGLYSNSTDTLFETATSGSDGKVTFNTKLKTLKDNPGANYDKYLYYVKEISAPDGYVIDTEKHYINTYYSRAADPNIFTYAKLGTKDLTVVENLFELDLNITKYDTVHAEYIEGVEFEVTKVNQTTNATESLGKITTDADGKASMTDLELGRLITEGANADTFTYKYIIEEVPSADNEYLYQDDTHLYREEIVIRKDMVVDNTVSKINYETEVPNTPKLVDLTINKVDDNNKKIEGAKFKIFPTNDVKWKGKVVQTAGVSLGTVTTDENGVAHNEVITYDADNDRNNVTPITIYPNNEYQIVEVSVPAPYVCNPTPHKFKVTDSSKATVNIPYETTITNKWQEGYIKIYKIASGEGSLAAGTEVPLEGAVYEVIALEDVTVEGTSYNKNDVIETITTGADGKATTTKKYPVEKKFGLKEKKAPVGYYLNKDVTEAVIPFDSTLVYDEENHTYPSTEEEWILEDAKNEVTFEKKDEDGNRLAGAVIQVKRGDKVIDEWTTKANEDHVITGTLEGGIEYTVHEKSAPDGYVATADFGFRVEVYAPTGEDGKQIVTIIDKSTKVRFSKKSTTGVDELPGAKLQVLDKDGNVIDEWISTTEPHEIVAELIAGAEYTFHEVVSPDGYAYSDDVPFTVAEDGEWQFVSMEDKPTTVKISKKSITGDDELPGASLQILDKDGNIIESWISTTEPHYITAKLIAGQKYTLHEEIAPDGYVIANDVIFTVNLKGEVDVVEMYDDYTKIEIAKYDADTGEILAGAKLQILDGEKVVEEWTSTTEPHRIDAKLIAGKEYILHEVEAPEYYELAADVKFTVSTDGRIDSITMSDYQKKGNIEIHKTTEGMMNLGGIKFVLSGTSDLGHEVNIEATTDDYGVALFEHIPLGTYTVTEDGETTPTAYLVADPVEVEVFYAETTTKEIFNEEKTGSIKVQKRTEGEMNLENIKFVLSGTSDSGREIEIESVTDSDGIATFENVPIGTYMITEDGESTPYAYMVAEPTEVEVFYAETTTKEIFNEEKTGSIEIHKTTEGMINLSGIKFILSGTSDSGREIEIEAITDSDGIATFENVPIGTYTITEYGATVPTAYLVADPVEVEVFYAETTTKEVHNDEKCGTIEIQKKTEGMINLEGIQFILSGTSDGGRKVEEYAVTDENGQATFYNIPTGTYTITEDGETVPYGYLVADDTSVEVYYAETTTVEIVNDTTKVSFSKHGMSGDDELPGAVLQVLDLEGNLIEEWTTTNKAHVIEGVLGVGQTYILHEKSAPAGYKVADDIEFVVEDSAEIQYVVMRDESAPDSSSSSSRPDSSSTPNSTPNTPPSTPPDNNPPTGGIGGGIAIAMLILGAATVVVRKKNDD